MLIVIIINILFYSLISSSGTTWPFQKLVSSQCGLTAVVNRGPGVWLRGSRNAHVTVVIHVSGQLLARNVRHIRHTYPEYFAVHKWSFLDVHAVSPSKCVCLEHWCVISLCLWCMHKMIVLTEDCLLLQKLFGYKMAQFCVTVESMWSSDAKFKNFTSKSVEQTLPSCVRIRREYFTVCLITRTACECDFSLGLETSPFLLTVSPAVSWRFCWILTKDNRELFCSATAVAELTHTHRDWFS